MNALDRKIVSNVVSELEALQAKITEEYGVTIRQLADAEQEKYDNMSDGLQQGEKGQAIEMAASALGEAADALDEGDIARALDSLGNLESI